MNKKTHVVPMYLLAGLMLLLAQPAAVLAADAYRFEMIVFERPNATTSEFFEPVDRSSVLQPTGASLSSRAIGGQQLGNIAYTLKRKGMLVHEHIAWVQTPGSRDRGTWFSIGDQRLRGAVRITRGRFLHVDADLLLYDDNGLETTTRAQLYRRMRSDELHYIDHPRMGIVIRADRIENDTGTEPNDNNDATAGEPRPAAPLAGESPS